MNPEHREITGHDEIYPDFSGGLGELPYSPQVPVTFSVEVHGLAGHDYAEYGKQIRGGNVGRKIVELRNRGLHVATQLRTGRVVFWVSEHRPLVTATVATVLTASTAAGVILFRKSRQRSPR